MGRWWVVRDAWRPYPDYRGFLGIWSTPDLGTQVAILSTTVIHQPPTWLPISMHLNSPGTEIFAVKVHWVCTLLPQASTRCPSHT